MCETEVAFSAAYVDWSPSRDLTDSAGRLSTAHLDYEMSARLRAEGFRTVPPKEQEEEARAILAQSIEALERRFGLDPVVMRYALCAKSLESGKPIVALAKALVNCVATDGRNQG